MHLRIQTTGTYSISLNSSPILEESKPNQTNTNVCTETTTALEALEKGFSDLMDLCDVVSEKFTTARNEFNEEKSNQMQS